IADYLSLGYITEPRTPFRAISRIPAGCYAIFRGDREEIVRYWDPASFAIEPISARDAVRKTQRLVEEAVEKQVMSDVPVGGFIGGGTASPLPAARASKYIGVDKVHTFSAAFAEESYDE